jgi:4-amino-4-deoxy-L-arabinose transferase-like glycosyltransferase
MSGEDAVFTRRVAIGIGALFAIRLVMVLWQPLLFDEGYYWLLSRHLAAGYYDHPPMAMLLTRLGTLLGGDAEFGVRLFSIPLGVAATWAIWRAAAILFVEQRLAALAAFYFNLTLLPAGVFISMTSDAPLLAASAFLLFFLAKIAETGRGAWWLAVGVTVGLGLLAKYTMVFLGFGVALWLVVVPEMRRWLATPWPWLAGLIAAALFTPVIYWNAQHDWISLARQFGRAGVTDRFPRDFIFGHIAGQIGLATPFIFILGSMGIVAFLAGRGGTRPARALIGAMFWPLTIYFLWHSLHKLVLFHWTAPVFPAFAIAAAAGRGVAWSGFWARLAAVSRRFAIPVALVMMGAVYLQMLFFVLPLGRHDIFAQQISPGGGPIVSEIEALRARTGAVAVITTSYRVTGWLGFYLPSRAPVVQINERIRWVNAPNPDPELFRHPLLYVVDARRNEVELVRKLYLEVEELAHLQRVRHGYVLDSYLVYRVARPKGDPFDHSPMPDFTEY